MNNQNLKNFYDVVIIGANIAGLECAKKLKNSKLNILLIEKNENVGKKICAGGVSPLDMKYLPENILNFPFQKILLHYKNKTTAFPKHGSIISTINRKKLLKSQIKNLKQYNNIKTLTGSSVVKISSNTCLELSSGKKFNFKFLVGADGSSSVVRKYLKIPSNKLEIVFQYLIPKEFKDFAIYLEPKLFGSGFVWIFPHKNFTSIGCGTDLKFLNPKKLKYNFDSWLKKNNIEISKAKLEIALLNYDYQGYKFKNIFLAGDAAGLASGFTGKGIYSAFVSGEQIANDILKENSHKNLINDWVRKKQKQEFFMLFLKKYIFKKFLFSIGIRVVSWSKIQKRITKFIA